MGRPRRSAGWRLPGLSASSTAWQPIGDSSWCFACAHLGQVRQQLGGLQYSGRPRLWQFLLPGILARLGHPFLPVGRCPRLPRPGRVPARSPGLTQPLARRTIRRGCPFELVPIHSLVLVSAQHSIDWALTPVPGLILIGGHISLRPAVLRTSLRRKPQSFKGVLYTLWLQQSANNQQKNT
eukprot:g33936.t1